MDEIQSKVRGDVAAAIDKDTTSPPARTTIEMEQQPPNVEMGAENHLPSAPSTAAAPAVAQVVSTDATTTATTATETQEVLAAVESSMSQKQQEHRPWDFSNRKVMVQGVNKFHDVKTVTKLVRKWLEEMQSVNPQPSITTNETCTETATDTAIATDISFDRIKKPPKGSWMVVTMTTEAMVQRFIEFINAKNDNTKSDRKGGRLFAKLAMAGEDDANNNSQKRRDRGETNNDTGDDPNLGDPYPLSKRQKSTIDGTDESSNAARRPIALNEMKDKITPLWRLTPQEQLDTKMKEMIKKCAIKIIQEIKAKFRLLDKEKTREKVKVYPWILQKRGIDMQPIVSAPTPLRNKCEFTFGYRYLFDPETQSVDTAVSSSTAATGAETEPKAADDVVPKRVPAVGFMVTGWAGGVCFSNALKNIPSEACAIVDAVNEFLTTSPLEPYDSKAHRGFWRILTMRTSRRTQECMIVIQHSPPCKGGYGDHESYDCTKEFAIERDRLVQVLTRAELPNDEQEEQKVKVTSIFFQEFGGLSNPTPDHPVQHAYGATHLTEKLGNCTFHISPGAFFQVNTEGAEILYQLAVDKVREVADTPEKTLLFDVCCGTGTIGLTCMKEGVVGHVVGVDISEPAIENAKANALLNFNDGDSLNRTRFVAARAEQVLGSEIKKAKQQKREEMKFVAVVDPARDGLHAEVVKAIRANEQIGRLVYVSCNPTGSLIRDAAMFCTPPSKRYTGRAFQIVSATPVDMFPLTNHCEMVMTFDRLNVDDQEAERPI